MLALVCSRLTNVCLWDGDELRSGIKREAVKKLFVSYLATIWISLSLSAAQESTAAWEAEVRSCVASKDWSSAVQAINRKLGESPNYENARAWRARVFTWSGQLIAAEDEYRWLIAAAPNNPDN